MASRPRFINAGFGPPIAVTTVNASRTSGSLSSAIATADANGGEYGGSPVCIVGNTQDCLLNFFHNTLYIGHIKIPANDSVTTTDPPFETVFVPPGGVRLMNASDTIKCAFTSGSMTAIVSALGGSY